ncbi:4'-phosphopantetheinyl transferase family protein [Flavobacterium sp. N3904]|uniref:4'-phosphopantetheinyl transferase family protein n=1 Tax=Flavobacterium sp. N3904 TaxID=2986835 RepID=UPI0022243040|nr:4'-phosphopantetheinyl transferase superfamily protein [Flavobacterium sp. N3904]
MQTSNLFISFSNIKGVEFIPDKNYLLNTNDVIIYTVYLPIFIGIQHDLAKFLNDTELDRAKRFFKLKDQIQFIISRAVLKFVLAAHTDLDAKSISLAYHFNKKPYLASHPWLYFNISHSEDWAVIAISRHNVGIDIEYLTEDFNFTNLLPDIFDNNEILAIQNAVNKKHAFYTSWTRKEAFVKALGKGIDEDFKHIPSLEGEYSVDSKLLRTASNWQVCSFNLADNYLGAVAFESSPISKNLLLYTLPNTMKDLMEMIQIRNN